MTEGSWEMVKEIWEANQDPNQNPKIKPDNETQKHKRPKLNRKTQQKPKININHKRNLNMNYKD